MTVIALKNGTLPNNFSDYYSSSRCWLLEANPEAGFVGLSIQSHIPNPKDIELYLNTIPEFVFGAESGHNFETWSGKTEDVFRVEFATIDEAKKVRLLLQKLGPNDYQKYEIYILPKHPRGVDFVENSSILNKNFVNRCHCFVSRMIVYIGLKLTKTTTHYVKGVMIYRV